MRYEVSGGKDALTSPIFGRAWPLTAPGDLTPARD